MNWRDGPIEKTADGIPKWKGLVELVDDTGRKLASVMWFYNEGPYYAFAADLTKDPDTIYRIGPVVGGLDRAKAVCIEGVEGKIKDLNKRAGYPRK